MADKSFYHALSEQLEAERDALRQEAASLRQRLEEEKERYEHLLRLKTPRYVCADHNGKTPRDGACIMCQLELAQKERDCVKFELQAKEATRLKDNEYLLSRVSQAEAAMADFEKWLESAKSDAENQRDQAYDRADTQRCDGLALAYEFALAELQRRRSPRAEPQEK